MAIAEDKPGILARHALAMHFQSPLPDVAEVTMGTMPYHTNAIATPQTSWSNDHDDHDICGLTIALNLHKRHGSDVAPSDRLL